MNLRFYTLWAINSPLCERDLCGQLDQMKAWGFDGAVFHPRFYPGVPTYLSDDYLAILTRIILYAKSIDMEFWLYDEDGWPSGTVGGQLLQKYPEDRQLWADLCDIAPSDEAVILSKFSRDGKSWWIVRRAGHGVDYLRPELASHFLELTYERYRNGLAPEAFDYVTTFFSDEPEFGLGHAYDSLSTHGAIPWTSDLPKRYFSRYGEEIETILPELFFESEASGKKRVQFWEFLTDYYTASFLDQINDWCNSHGKRFTAHIKGEEHPLFQVPMVGSCHQVYQHLALPGIDALERYVSENFFPRQVASAAQQFGNGDCMVEAFGGAGWGARPEDLERYLIWLTGHGLNHIVLHLFQSKLTTHAMHDWPSSIPVNMTWRDAFPQLLDRVRKHANSASQNADTLVVAPYRGIAADFEPRELLDFNIHNASTYPDSKAGQINRQFLELIDQVDQSGASYHVCDERTIDDHGREESGKLVVGNCSYETVIVAHGARFAEHSIHALSKIVNLRRAPAELETTALNVANKFELTPILVDWQVVGPVQNAFPLEATQVSETSYLASFEATTEIPARIVFLDNVEHVMLNGSVIAEDLFAILADGTNTLKFDCSNSSGVPFAYLEGTFAVKSGSAWTVGPNRTVMSAGPFTLEEQVAPEIRDLTASGFPFCKSPVTLRGSFLLSKLCCEFHLIEPQADCANIAIDGINCGFVWGPDWGFATETELSAGVHEIEVQIFPSTMNLYGPHHHIDDDLQVISPAQYEYRKNFADRPDAPENTRTAAWHVK